MKALDLLKTILENGLSSYNEEDDTVLVNGWWVTLEECIAELEALKQPKSCEECKYGYIGRKRCTHTDMFFFDEYSIYMDIDFCCNRYEPKDEQ